MLTCQDCGKKSEDVYETFCPFAADVDNDPTVAITVCEDCYQQRADNV